ncbi:fibroblast growth factor 19 [Microcaecilia unicolor]|uniref:Fibroblast growth factor n=1 Tax=Microcaecilia unicolor TaxID=1415580 RepID=A0A6P7XXY9_9AMPH|nr:fibroblast growth factor 19 [Microcaecilia unicolor]
MWRRLSKSYTALILMELCLARVVHPIDAGPHVNYGWGEPIRLRHLYTASKHGLFSYFLRISEDGRVDGVSVQSSHSLLEIRAVAVRTVAIKGVHSSRYLCMDSDGRLHGLISYSPEDCSFEEELLPDGYNMYKSKKHGIPISLSRDRQRQQYRGSGILPLSHFLPMINRVPVESDYDKYSEDIQPIDPAEMDPYGITSQRGMESPSYQKK